MILRIDKVPEIEVPPTAPESLKVAGGSAKLPEVVGAG